MLIAPAGYGKTTLAEQWVARDGRVGIWYTARSASTDVAALALGIARAATAIIDDADHRLREHLRALPAPAENVQTLAEILSEDLAAWPANAWLVLDDYHEITPEPKAEDFVETLVALSPIQFLIASRVRPCWVASKRVMYGDVLELSQTALAMDSEEAADVLAGRTARHLLLDSPHWPRAGPLSSGWQACHSPRSARDVDQVPESLYRFFADEVFGGLDPAVQRSLSALSVVPSLDREIIWTLLGERDAEITCNAALDVGLFVERGTRIELHPLARVFLDERTQFDSRSGARASEACLRVYRDRKDWDAAFELIKRTQLPELLDLLIAASLDDLLDTARLSTLETWCRLASEADVESALTRLAQAEVRLRDGHLLEATAYAEMAAVDPELAFRALCVAGRAAHLASREEAGLELFNVRKRSPRMRISGEMRSGGSLRVRSILNTRTRSMRSTSCRLE